MANPGNVPADLTATTDEIHVSAATIPPSSASAILAAAGVEEDHSFYGPFTTEEQKAVLTVPQKIRAAWADNDADAFADVFVENGSVLLRDDQLTSRAEIHSYMTAGFEGSYSGARVYGWPLAVRFLGDHVALVVTQGGIILDGEDEIAPEREIRASWIVVRHGPAWKLLAHHSSPVAG